jgi:hypothetical protein
MGTLRRKFVLILAMAKQSLCTDYIKYIEGGCVELIILAQSSLILFPREEHAYQKRPRLERIFTNTGQLTLY